MKYEVTVNEYIGKFLTLKAFTRFIDTPNQDGLLLSVSTVAATIFESSKDNSAEWVQVTKILQMAS